MSQPTLTEVHVNRPLTDLSLAYIQDPSRSVARQVFPAVAVDKPSNSYFTYDRAEWLRDEAGLRAPGAEAQASGYSLSTDTYNAVRYALKRNIADPIRAASDVADLDREAMVWLMAKLLIKQDVTFATKFIGTGIWGTDKVGTTDFVKWNDAASTPIEDIRSGRRTVLGNTGFEPNVLLLGKLTFDRLLDHPDIIDRLKYGQTAGAPAMASTDALARLFAVDKVVVSTAIKNSAAEGVTASYGNIITNDVALLVYAAPSPGLLTASAGYTFTWGGAGGASAGGTRVKSYRDELRESDVIEAEVWYDQKVVSSALGYYFSDACD